jgi:hypothetical protein
MRENSDDDEEVTNDGTDSDSCDGDSPETITPGIHPSTYSSLLSHAVHAMGIVRLLLMSSLINTCGRERKGWGRGKGLL